MKAIVIKQAGGPEVLSIEDRPEPQAKPGHVVIDVKAFGLNQAEVYFRKGLWGEVAEITGIECVGTVSDDPDNNFIPGQKVVAVVGGLGRELNGSYAEKTSVPASNVVAINSDLPWEDIAVLPESYISAWTCIKGIMQMAAHQVLLVRGGTSALGQAAINIAVNEGIKVIATTRKKERIDYLKDLGCDGVLIEQEDLSAQLLQDYPNGIDAVLDIIGNKTVVDSSKMLRRGGHLCVVGFLGGGGPLSIEPVFEFPSGRYISVFASAIVTGSEDFPLSEIPMQTIVDRAACGAYKAKPANVFKMEEIQSAHQYLESGLANGKIVVTV